MYFCIPLTFSTSARGGSATYLLSIPKLRPAPQSVVNGDEAILEDDIVNTVIWGFQPLLVHWKGCPQSDDAGVDTNYN